METLLLLVQPLLYRADQVAASAPPGLRAWTASGAWTTNAELRVLALFAASGAIAAIGLLLVAFARYERRLLEKHEWNLAHPRRRAHG